MSWRELPPWSALYRPILDRPVSANAEDTITMVPFLLLRRYGSAARQQLARPVTLVRRIASQLLRRCVGNRPICARRSVVGQDVDTAEILCQPVDRRGNARRIGDIGVPREDRSSRPVSRQLGGRIQSARLHRSRSDQLRAPSCKNRLAVAYPIPRAAPVMIAVRP